MRSRRQKVIIGKAHHDKLKVVKSVKRVGIFVSRLHEDTTCDNIKRYVSENIGCEILSVEKLKSKYTGYASFHIECTQDQSQKLLDENSWDNGLLVRRWYAARATTSDKNNQL